MLGNTLPSRHYPLIGQFVAVAGNFGWAVIPIIKGRWSVSVVID